MTTGNGSGKRARGCRSMSSDSVTASSSLLVSTSGAPAYAMPFGSYSLDSACVLHKGKKVGMGMPFA